MITNTKNYTKTKPKKQKTDRPNPSTNGKSKAIQTKLHRSIHIHTKKKK